MSVNRLKNCVAHFEREMAGRLFENLEPSFEDTKWKVRGKRGADAERLIDYIVLAEFDIDTGESSLLSRS
jgi:hypothetical protein